MPESGDMVAESGDMVAESGDMVAESGGNGRKSRPSVKSGMKSDSDENSGDKVEVVSITTSMMSELMDAGEVEVAVTPVSILMSKLVEDVEDVVSSVEDVEDVGSSVEDVEDVGSSVEDDVVMGFVTSKIGSEPIGDAEDSSIGDDVAEESVTPSRDDVAVESVTPIADDVAVESVPPSGDDVAVESVFPIGDDVAVESVIPTGDDVAVESIPPTALVDGVITSSSVISVVVFSPPLPAVLLPFPVVLLSLPLVVARVLLLLILTLDSVLEGVVSMRMLSNVVEVVDDDAVGDVTDSPSSSSLGISSGGAVTPADSKMSAAMATAADEPLLLLTASSVESTAVLPLRSMARQRPWSSL